MCGLEPRTPALQDQYVFVSLSIEQLPAVVSYYDGGELVVTTRCHHGGNGAGESCSLYTYVLPQCYMCSPDSRGREFYRGVGISANSPVIQFRFSV